MLSKLKLTIVTAAVLVGGLTSLAAAHGGSAKPALEAKFDVNKDGTLDAAEKAKLVEAKKAMRAEKHKAVLARFDVNKNGTLEPAEKQAMHDERIKTRFAALDTNRDGALSLDEFKAGKPGHAGKPGKAGKRHHARGKHAGRGHRKP